MEIQLEEHEKKIFVMILNCSGQYFKNSTPRVAGGWVRDKLMGIQSFDLDIALDGVSGYEFATKLRELHLDEISSAGLVKSNPEKSKHLETAVLNINGQLIDFVNLRKETYTSTRIPLIEFGTPYEDAHRRDLTINALFYNIKTKEIEDFTGKGIEDLRLKIIRTPLEPETTFRDDPLRILRVLRFHSKLNFDICEDIYKALKNEDLKKQLANKVSKERINIELFKMINYPKGHLGILELIKNGYVNCITNNKEGLSVTYDEACGFFRELLDFLDDFIEGPLLPESSYSTITFNRSANLTDKTESTVFLNTPCQVSGTIGTDESFSEVNLNVPKMETSVVKSKNTDFFNLEIPEIFRDSRWLFNLYIILYKTTKQLTTKDKRQCFVNSEIVKHSLVCSNKINDSINKIEKGLILLENVDLFDLSLYNLFLIVFYLKDLWFEILTLEFVLRRQSNRSCEEVKGLINAIKTQKIPEKIIFKSPLDISTLQNLLNIESKYLSYFSAESIILKQSKAELSNDDVICHLKENKDLIISKHSKFK